MNRKLIVAATLVAWLGGLEAAWAADSFGPVTVDATVGAIESLDCSIVKCIPSGGNDCPTPVTEGTMNFSTLSRINTCGVSGTEPCALFAPHFYKIFCGVNTGSRPYTIKQTGTALTSGANTLTNNCWVFTPIDKVDTLDPGGVANEDCAECTFGPKVSANTVDALWINTNARTDIVVSQAAYGVSAPPNCVLNGATDPVIPPSQPSGTYSGTVIWTVTPNS